MDGIGRPTLASTEGGPPQHDHDFDRPLVPQESHDKAIDRASIGARCERVSQALSIGFAGERVNKRSRTQRVDTAAPAPGPRDDPTGA